MPAGGGQRPPPAGGAYNSPDYEVLRLLPYTPMQDTKGELHPAEGLPLPRIGLAAHMKRVPAHCKERLEWFLPHGVTRP